MSGLGMVIEQPWGGERGGKKAREGRSVVPQGSEKLGWKKKTSKASTRKAVEA